ncbi:hypothetical protein [Ideonella sp. YS5]|uniref:hypothetical protein n=1 Tax=Ideonella sp. YS5 TaxID=3453714 RepID=UPI003EED6E32
MKLRHVIAAAAFAAVSATSFAQTATPAPTPVPVDPGVQRGTNTPLIDKHEASQEQRIKEGKQSGELTRHEARRLKGEQKAVDRAQTKAAADGTVTAQERQHIRKAQNKAGKDIYRQKHDGASAPSSGK